MLKISSHILAELIFEQDLVQQVFVVRDVRLEISYQRGARVGHLTLSRSGFL